MNTMIAITMIKNIKAMLAIVTVISCIVIFNSYCMIQCRYHTVYSVRDNTPAAGPPYSMVAAVPTLALLWKNGERIVDQGGTMVIQSGNTVKK